jgi:hypothetical protein
MIVSINQPAYLPWLGYFHRIASSDLHIMLDHVQFEKNSFTNRNKIRTPQGWAWLTVPVATKNQFGHLPINGLRIAAGSNWQDKHWASLRQNYSRAACFQDYMGVFEGFYKVQWNSLSELIFAMNDWMLREALGIGTPLVYSSELGVGGSKSELVLNLCRAVGASIYLSGPLGRDYLDLPSFDAAGIEVRYHDYAHPRYAQTYPGFESHMAAADLLFNQGVDSASIMNENN